MQYFFHSYTIMRCIIQVIANVFINCEYKTEKQLFFLFVLRKTEASDDNTKY